MANQRNTTLPTEKEIFNLPRWARVAFAARCARRVLPLYQAGQPSSVEEGPDPIDEAIAFAENTAGAVGVARDSDLVREASSMISCVEADLRTRAAYDFEADAAKAALAAVQAADSAAAAAAAEGRAVQVNDGRSTRDADAAVTCAADAAAACAADDDYAPAEEIILKAIRLDFEHIRNTTKQEEWNDQVRVPPEFFGPLWPDGEPQGWPYEPSVDAAHGRTIRIPVHMIESLSTLRSVARELLQELGREATIEEIARKAKMTVSEVRRVHKLGRQPIPLHRRVVAGENPHLGDMTADDTAESIVSQHDTSHAESSTPEIEVYLDPGEASRDEIQAVLDALSDLHFAAGGLGLEFRTDGHRVYAVEGVAP